MTVITMGHMTKSLLLPIGMTFLLIGSYHMMIQFKVSYPHKMINLAIAFTLLFIGFFAVIIWKRVYYDL